MATTTKTRTNYVHITDLSRFEEIISKAHVRNKHKIHIISHNEGNETLYGFYSEDEIYGFPVNDTNFEPNTDDEDVDYNVQHSRLSFINALKTVIKPGDALIITTISSEEMNYLYAETDIITCDDYRYLCIEDVAMNEAVKMLHNPNWTTRNSY